ncbi:MAG: hypothetical protein AAB670_00915 [Patescibacteria group bacterium]
MNKKVLDQAERSAGKLLVPIGRGVTPESWETQGENPVEDRFSPAKAKPNRPKLNKISFAYRSFSPILSLF